MVRFPKPIKLVLCATALSIVASCGTFSSSDETRDAFEKDKQEQTLSLGELEPITTFDLDINIDADLASDAPIPLTPNAQISAEDLEAKITAEVDGYSYDRLRDANYDIACGDEPFVYTSDDQDGLSNFFKSHAIQDRFIDEGATPEKVQEYIDLLEERGHANTSLATLAVHVETRLKVMFPMSKCAIDANGVGELETVLWNRDNDPMYYSLQRDSANFKLLPFMPTPNVTSHMKAGEFPNMLTEFASQLRDAASDGFISRDEALNASASIDKYGEKAVPAEVSDASLIAAKRIFENAKIARFEGSDIRGLAMMLQRNVSTMPKPVDQSVLSPNGE